MLGIRVTSRRRGTTATSCRTTKARAVPASARHVSSGFCAPTAQALEQALYMDGAPLAAQKYHSLYFHRRYEKADEASCGRWAPSASSPVMLARTNPPCGWRSGTMRASTRPRILLPQRRRGGRPSLMREPPWVLNLVPRLRDPPQPQLPFPPQLQRLISPTLATLRYAPRGPTA